MMHALNDIASSADVESTYNATVYRLNYAACNPDNEIIYQASDMILQVNSDAKRCGVFRQSKSPKRSWWLSFSGQRCQVTIQ